MNQAEGVIPQLSRPMAIPRPGDKKMSLHLVTGFTFSQ